MDIVKNVNHKLCVDAIMSLNFIQAKIWHPTKQTIKEEDCSFSFTQTCVLQTHWRCPHSCQEILLFLGI